MVFLTGQIDDALELLVRVSARPSAAVSAGPGAAVSAEPGAGVSVTAVVVTDPLTPEHGPLVLLKST